MPGNYHTTTAKALTPSDQHGKCCYLKIQRLPLPDALSCGVGNGNGGPLAISAEVELVIEDQNMEDDLRKYRHVVVCSMRRSIDTHGGLLQSSDQHKQPLLGTLVSNHSLERDKSGREVCLFKFPELICQSVGELRLTFGLVRCDPKSTPETKHIPYLCTVESEPFIVRVSGESPK